MLLSILIPTTTDRRKVFNVLLDKLTKMSAGIEGVEIMYCEDNKQMTIGAKRQHLIENATGEYVVQIDSDDDVSDSFISDILEALETKPDCVGFNGVMTTNGKNWENFNISLRNKSWFKKNSVYYRSINHLSPVKKSLALKAGFNINKRHGEDYEYSMKLLPLLKTEVFINKDLYTYKYISNK